MKKIVLILTGFLLLGQIMAATVSPIKSYSEGSDCKVLFVGQFSEFKEISELDLLFFKKVLKKAEKIKAAAIIFELDTPGGRVDVALRYISLFSKTKIPVIVYLNPQGISAGMIIALGANRIAINPMGVIGDAMPLEIGMDGIRPIAADDDEAKPEKKENQEAETAKKVNPETPAVTPEKSKDKASDSAKDTLERLLDELKNNKKSPEPGTNDKKLVDQKFLTVFFKVLQVLAEKNDRPVRVIRATSDPYLELTMQQDGIDHKKGSPLTLSAKEALKLNVVDYVVESKADLLRQLGIPNAEIIVVEKDAVEQIVGFLAYPAISGILIMLGLIGIFIELKTPGFGVAGTLGLLCLLLFFLGHIASGASEWGPMVIFFVGLILLLIEIFVIPGFGLVGVMGIGCMLLSFFAAFGWENIGSAVEVVALSFSGSVVVMVLLAMYVLPKSSWFKKLSLTAVSGNMDTPENSAIEVKNDFIGKIGVALTTLRPGGKIEIDGKRYDGTTDGEFIVAGSPVEVVGFNGFELRVKLKNGL